MTCFRYAKEQGRSLSLRSGLVLQHLSLMLAGSLLFLGPFDSHGQILTSGETVLGSISVPTEVDRYDFSLTAGEPLYLLCADQGGGGSFEPELWLYRSDNTLIAGPIWGYDRAVMSGSVTNPGAYYVLVNDHSLNATGTYLITLTKVLGPPWPDPDGGELANGVTHAGSVSPLGDIDRYTLNLTAGEPYFLVAADTSESSGHEPQITLYRSDGSVVMDNWGYDRAVISGTAPVTGTYYLIVYDHSFDSTGTYLITLTKVLGPPWPDPDGGELIAGTTRTGSIRPMGDIDLYKVNLTAGGLYYWLVTDTSGSIDPQITLYRSDGSVALDNWGYDRAVFSGTAMVSGTYYVLIRDYNFDGAGTYLVSFGRLDPTSGTSAIAGSVVNSVNGGGLVGGVVQAWRQSGGSSILQALAPTDSSGHYQLSSLPAGSYDLRAYRSGFLARTNLGVSALSGQTVTANFQIQPAPDLVLISTLDLSPDQLTSGNTLVVSYTVLNQGYRASTDSQTRIQLKLGSSSTTTTEAPPHTTPGLAVGASTRENVTFPIPSSVPAGAYTVYVTLDYSNAIGQSETQNDTYQSVVGALILQGLPTPPSITSVFPNPLPGLDGPQPFFIYGANFVSGCNVTLRDLTAGQVFANRTISSLSETQIRIDPNFTAVAHNWSVEVINPDGQSSGPFPFAVGAVPGEPASLGVLWRPNPNFNNRPADRAIDTIVIHTTQGPTAQDAFDTLLARGLSAHYVIDPTGQIYQLVELSKRAWHANYYNDRSIGIEMVGYDHQEATWNSQNLAALEELVAYLVKKYDIRMAHPLEDASAYPQCLYTGVGLLGHSQIQPGCNSYDTKTDPGVYFPWPVFVQAVLERARPVLGGIGGGPLRPPANGQFQFRVSAPGLQQVTLQASVDLINWVDLVPVPITGGQGVFTDLTADSHGRRFYRAKP